uniref:energy transducer TonB n=1 Tax=Altererythrobacter segetis TaxID=1104773 RepID=UPI00140E4CAC|nr:energy transducer TonB [Altererythrobacter segetis]
MAYFDRSTDPARRATAITGVIVIHALIGYVLVTGLVAKFVPPPHVPFVGGTIALPPPPPPQPERTDKPSPRAESETASEQKTPLTKTDDTVIETKDESVGVEVTPTPTATYSPPTSLGLKPKAAAPRNQPSGWATTDDYPSRDLRQGNEGTAFFRAIVGTNGRVSACEIVRSSGHPGLDAATCKAVTARARFEAATNENGEKVVGTYSSSVRWQIPR